MIKIILIGKIGSGKTSYFNRIIKNKFNENEMRTIGMNIENIELLIDRQFKNYEIYDTSGYKEYFGMLDCTLKQSDFIFLFVDISYEINKEEIIEYINEIERIISTSQKKIEIFIIGSKNDKKKIRKNKLDELEFIIDNKYQYIELSSKENDNCLFPFYVIEERLSIKELKNNKQQLNSCSFL